MSKLLAWRAQPRIAIWIIFFVVYAVMAIIAFRDGWTWLLAEKEEVEAMPLWLSTVRMAVVLPPGMVIVTVCLIAPCLLLLSFIVYLVDRIINKCR